MKLWRYRSDEIIKTTQGQTCSDGLPFVTVVGPAIGFLLACSVAEVALSPVPSPLHWLVSRSGTALGTGLGYLWY